MSPSATRYLEPVADVAHVGPAGLDPGREVPTTAAIVVDPTRCTWSSGSGVAATCRECDAPCGLIGDAWRPLTAPAASGVRSANGQAAAPVERHGCPPGRHQLHPCHCRTAMLAVSDACARPARERHVAHANQQVSGPLRTRAPDKAEHQATRDPPAGLRVPHSRGHDRTRHARPRRALPRPTRPTPATPRDSMTTPGYITRPLNACSDSAEGAVLRHWRAVGSCGVAEAPMDVKRRFG